jgi:DNA-binding CsgD family transcriptional regulator
MTAADDRVGLVCLEPQLAHLRQLAGDIDGALECCQRGQAKLSDLSPRGAERWITGQLQLIAGLAHYRRPGAAADCGIALRRALRARHDLGNEADLAYCLEVLGWLAAREARYDRAAWLLGAADPLWRRAGSRLSNIAIMEQSHQRVARAAREALGDTGYETAHTQGSTLDLDTIVGYAMNEHGSASRPAAKPTAAPAAENDGPGGGGGDVEAAAPVTAAALTRREREIAILVASGLSNREIAAQLFISKRTVDAHVEHIFAKLEISSRVKLTLWLRSEVRIGA